MDISDYDDIVEVFWQRQCFWRFPPALKSETEQSLRPRPCFKCEVNTTGTDDIFF